MRNPYRIGEKVYLRPLERDDATLLQRWVNDAEVTRNLTLWRPMSLDDELAFIERTSNDPQAFSLGIVLRADDRLIGTAGLHNLDWRNRSASFGIEIGEKDEWGRGYGTDAARLIVNEAFQTMNLNRIWLLVYEFNARGIRSYEKVGFVREGTHRQFTFRDGRYWDAHTMAILRSEWETAAKPV